MGSKGEHIMKAYDIVVIGGGAAGLTVAAGAANFGSKVALIEKDRLGGDCLWAGCVPTKALIASSKIVHTAYKSSQIGLNIDESPKMRVVRERLTFSMNQLKKHDAPERFEALGITIYKGTASFVNSHTLCVNEKTIFGKRIIIATGSYAFIPPIKGLQESGFLTNKSALTLTDVPKRLAIIGGGPIGLEFAQAFARLQSKVTVIEMATEILTKEEPKLAAIAKSELEKEGISILTGAKVVEVRKGQAKEVVIQLGDTYSTLVVDDILVASGRHPNIEDLNYKTIGLEIERGAIKVNKRLQTNVSHIYAIGDVNGQYPFTHVAGLEGKVVVANAVLGLRNKIDYTHVPWVTYIDPEIFHLGLTEDEARKKYNKVRVFEVDLDDVDRFVCDNTTTGMVKVITDHKGYILGAHAIGSYAGDFMQEIIFAKKYKHKIGSLSQVIHPYPTHVAALQKIADLYWREKLFKGIMPKIIKSYVRLFR